MSRRARKNLLFVSYAFEDRQLAEALGDILRRAFDEVLDVFVSSQEDSIRIGEPIPRRIHDALKRARVLIVLASPTSVLKPWINYEVGFAKAVGATVMPVCVRGMAKAGLPNPLGTEMEKAADLDSDAGLTELLRSVAHEYDLPLRNPAIRSIYARLAPLNTAQLAFLGDVKSEILPYDSDRFHSLVRAYLHGPLSHVRLLSYTGETTPRLFGFGEMGLNIRLDLLTRDWHEEAKAQVDYNRNHPSRPGDWAKASRIRRTAAALPQEPWSRAADQGGRIEIRHRFFADPPAHKMLLFFDHERPVGGFWGFYKHDPSMALGNPSIYVGVDQPMVHTTDPRILEYLRSQFDDVFFKSRTIAQLDSESGGSRGGARPRALIFDWDDVFTRSTPGYLACYEYSVREVGVQLPDDDLRAILKMHWGKHPRELLEHLLRNEVSQALLDRAYEIYESSLLTDRFLAHVSPVEGSHECLRALDAAGYRMGIATGMNGRLLREQMMTRFGFPQVFGRILSVYDVGAPQQKPRADFLRIVMEDLDVEPADVFYIGDAENDVRMAHDAGTKCVVVRTGHLDEARARALKGVAAVLSDVTALPGWLASR